MLNEKEIKELNRIVTMYLDYAENQAEKQVLMKMKDWVGKLDSFLQFNDYSVLKDAGTISSGIAKKLAEQEYDKFRIEQDQKYESDFDREIKKLRKNKPDWSTEQPYWLKFRAVWIIKVIKFVIISDAFWSNIGTVTLINTFIKEFKKTVWAEKDKGCVFIWTLAKSLIWQTTK